MPRWVVDAGEQFGLDAGALQGCGKGHELGGVADQAFHLVDGEGGRLVAGDLPDFPGKGEGCLQLRVDLDPDADLLGEDRPHPAAARASSWLYSS